jgi:hypothetical protein
MSEENKATHEGDDELFAVLVGGVLALALWARVALWKARVTWVRVTPNGWTPGEWQVIDTPPGGALVRRG